MTGQVTPIGIGSIPNMGAGIQFKPGYPNRQRSLAQTQVTCGFEFRSRHVFSSGSPNGRRPFP